jgi:hypothetical protein
MTDQHWRNTVGAPIYDFVEIGDVIGDGGTRGV